MDNVKALNIFEINQVILSFEESYSHICAEQYSSPEYYNKKSSLINQIQEARDSYKKSRDSILKEEKNLSQEKSRHSIFFSLLLQSQIHLFFL